MISPPPSAFVVHTTTRANPVAIEHNGGTARTYGCLCGGTVSMCAKWPMPKRVEKWIAQHNATCQPKVKA